MGEDQGPTPWLLFLIWAAIIVAGIAVTVLLVLAAMRKLNLVP